MKSVAQFYYVGSGNAMLEPAHPGKHNRSAMKLQDSIDAMWPTEGWMPAEAFRTF